MGKQIEIDPQLDRLFESLRDMPKREPENAARGKVEFLALAKQMAESQPVGVSRKENRRHNHWMQQISTFFSLNRKERKPMVGAISTILLIFSLVMGGSGLTVAAAQQSMPVDGLYPIKTWSEQIRVQLTENGQARLRLALELSDRRAGEMQQMLRNGQVPPEAVQTRWMGEIDRALALAAAQPEPQRAQNLTQIRERLQAQEQTFTNLEPPANPQADGILARTRVLLQDRLRICDESLQNPDAIRDQDKERDQLQDRSGDGLGQDLEKREPANPPDGETPGSGSGYGPGSGEGVCEGCDGSVTGDEENGAGENTPWMEDVPTPGSGYGTGPGEGDGGEACEGCGSGENSQWKEETPEPDAGIGPGPQPESPQPGSEDGNGAGPEAGDEAGSGSHSDDGSQISNESGHGSERMDGGAGGKR